jgi:hypothetical protein
LSDSHKDEILTLREVLGTPSFQDTEVLAGAAGLDRVVASVNVMENPDIIPWVKNRELLVTVGYSLAGRGKDLATLINDLADQDLAGFGIKLGPYITEVSADALDAANRRNFPILSLPPTVSFDDLIADVYRARGSLLLGGLHRRSDREHELISVSLEGGGPNEVAARLAQLVSCEVVVLGPNNEVLSHHSAGGEASEEDRDPRDSSRFDDAVTAPIVFGSTYVGQLYVLPNEGPLEGFSPGLVPRCAQRDRGVLCGSPVPGRTLGADTPESSRSPGGRPALPGARLDHLLPSGRGESLTHGTRHHAASRASQRCPGLVAPGPGPSCSPCHHQWACCRDRWTGEFGCHRP